MENRLFVNALLNNPLLSLYILFNMSLPAAKRRCMCFIHMCVVGKDNKSVLVNMVISAKWSNQYCACVYYLMYLSAYSSIHRVTHNLEVPSCKCSSDDLVSVFVYNVCYSEFVSHVHSE